MKKRQLQNLKKALTAGIVCIASIYTAKAQPSVITVVTVQDSVAINTHWTSDKQYLLKGYVYVVNGTTLTIDPGTIIKGDKNTKGALIVERGAKIMAQGTLDQPIVFTSNQPAGQRTYGDWGGVILCGKSYNNTVAGVQQIEGGPRSFHGGTDLHDNSGVLSYVRIEFGGVAFSPNNEINGLTLGSVGDGTQMDHIQVSYSGDDSYEWFGGSVNAKYLVAYRGWDDDFDTDNGYRGNNQFVVGIRDPFAADVSGSKGFESDSYGGGTTLSGLAGDVSGLTRPVFSNVTEVGPLVSPTSTAYDPQFVAAVHIRRGSAISIMNSVLVGFPAGIVFDESSSSYGSTSRNYDILGSGADSIGQIRNTIIAGIPTNGTPTKKELVYVINGARSLTSTSADADTAANASFSPFTGPYDFFQNAANQNKMYATEQTGVVLGNPFNLANPNLVPNSTSPIVFPVGNTAVKPSFISSKLQDPFFTSVNYIGAFAGTGSTSDNWMNGWCNFDPVNTDYSHTTTGINTLADNNGISVYPNPAKDEITLSMNNAKSSEITVTIYDITGKLVSTLLNEKANQGFVNYKLDVSAISAGVYFVTIKTNEITKTIKFIIAK
jgi:hypothetical protein